MSKKKKFRERSNILHVVHSFKLQELEPYVKLKPIELATIMLMIMLIIMIMIVMIIIIKKTKNSTNSYHTCSLPPIL